MRKLSLKRTVHKKSEFLLAQLKKIFRPVKKIQRKLTHFFYKIKHGVKKNKLISNPYFIRLIILAFFIGLNIQLLPYFLKTTRVQLPANFMNYLDSLGIINKEELNFDFIPKENQDDQPSLDPQLMFEKLNEQRAQRDLEPFAYNEKLASAAAELLREAEKYDYELGDRPFTEEFKTALQNSKYNYEHVSHNMVVGPLLEEGVIDAWLSNEQQLQALFDDDFQDVGLATTIIKTKYNETLGVTVQVLGLEQQTRVQTQTPVVNKAKIVFPPISNEEVFQALNTYRQAHSIYELKVDDNLCQYAEKRVQDLLAFGTLDNHQGFLNDFADPNNLPEPIRNFNGTKIAENLAYQYCRNMTTNEDFIAESGAAIIEWCFDSSTLGHREAQLSTEFGHACVRSAQGMFVIIFGGT
jgi:uncharacterized protein YkwD